MAERAREALGTDDAITLRSERFGTCALRADRVISFPEGLIGFRAARRFALLEPTRPGSPFRCLVCLDAPEVGFVVCEPGVFWAGYTAELMPLAGVRVEDLAVLVIITVPENGGEMTANLLAPLVVDSGSRTGRQLVLDTGRYSTRHPVLPAPSAPLQK